jgi:thiol-disulfide isomerase/thioredoxin
MDAGMKSLCGGGLVLAMLLSWTAAGAQELEPLPATSSPVPLARMIPDPATLAQTRGRVLLLNFWASWCASCREEMPSLNRLAGAFAGRPLTIVAVAVSDTVSDMDEFIRHTPLSFPVFRDPDQSRSRSIGVQILPTTLILDRDRRPRYRAVGALDWDEPALRAEIEALLSPARP